MFDDVLKSVLLWILGGLFLIIALVYTVSNTVLTSIDTQSTAGTVDRYETYIANNKK